MLLEGLATTHAPVAALAGGWTLRADGTLDLLTLLNELADSQNAARAARLFHATLAAALVAWVAQAAQRRGVTTVAAAGGCLLNRLLAQALAEGLAARGLRFILPRDLPPNDGGLALGQAWVALYAATNGSTVALGARSKK